MLLQFLVSNYASIKDEKILSLEPSSDIDHYENIICKSAGKALNLIAIYGANASGKTSLFRAMTTALNYIRHSNEMQINQPIPVNAFRFDDATAAAPGKFEFTFIASDGLKYIYGFSADKQRVHEEYLYVYKSAKASMLFDRHFDEFKFPRSEKKNLEILMRMNTSNKLFLATATAWNAVCTTIPFKWLSEGIDSYTNDDNITGMALDMYRKEEAANVEFTKKLMKQADINISDISVESKKITEAGSALFPGLIINGQLIQTRENYEIKISTGHTVTDETGEEKTYTLDFGEESLGTKQLFYMAPLLRDTFEKGKVLVIDEIDRSLHPFIVKFLVNLFRNKKINTLGAQLIFTTHETTLLSLDTFRRDQIFFTEKDAVTGATDIYSLDDFSVRKTDNIEKGYLIGRYGAIPFLHTEEIV